MLGAADTSQVLSEWTAPDFSAIHYNLTGRAYFTYTTVLEAPFVGRGYVWGMWDDTLRVWATPLDAAGFPSGPREMIISGASFVYAHLIPCIH
jgi:hypothetical protein